MYCTRCQNELPDGVETCPVCGMMTRRGLHNQNKPLKTCIRAVDGLSLFMTIIHAIVWATGSHYLDRAIENMLGERWLRYELHPALIWVDILFAILFVSIPVFSAMMRYSLMRERRVGLIYLSVTLAVALFSGVLYPILTQAATGIPSSLLGFCIIQAVVYGVLVAVPAVMLYRSDKLKY